MGENNGTDSNGTPPQSNGNNLMALSGGAVVTMPLLPQAGEVFVGPGAKKEAELLGLGLTKLSSRRKDEIAMAKRFAMDLSIKQIMLRQQKAQQENQQKQQMYAQALSLMSRVYIGSISFEVREDMLKKAFEVFGPIKSINMSWDAVTGHHKGFAFLEYDVPEAALLAQESMNGQLMGGRNLKVNSMVGRPTNMPQAQPIIEMVQQDARKYFRVYVASVHPDLSESDLKSVFEAFGEVVRCQLARQISGRGMHRGFGYIEFNNLNSMTEAIAGMNMFDLGGQFLRVGRCITPPEALTYLTPASAATIPAAAAVAAAAVTAKVMAAEASAPKRQSSGSSSRNQSPAPAAILPPKTEVEIKKEEIETPPPEPMEVDEPIEDQIPRRVVTDEIKTEPPFVPPPPSVVVPSVIGSLQPPSVVVPNAIGIPPPSLMTIPQPGLFVPPPPPAVGQTASRRNLSFNSPQQHNQPLPPSLVMAPSLALPSASATGEPIKLTSSQRKKLKKEAKARQTFTEKMDKILDRQKQKQDEDLAQPISFGAIDPLLAPKDPLDEDSQTEQGGALPAIMGPGRGGDNIQSMALALMDGGGALMAIQKKKEEKEASAEASKKGKDSKHRRRRNNLDPKKIQPKLNSAQALVAATKAGEMSDALKNEVMNSEDATLASQEGLEIRGNDARHLLMAKLMRTNRSCVLVLRNMVRPEDIDEFLEDEIRQECAKYGAVVEVVIAHDASAQIVKIFVKFADPTQVDAAKAALDGRFFGGNTVKAEAYDQILFDHGDYKG